jgi:hypothetical protein
MILPTDDPADLLFDADIIGQCSTAFEIPPEGYDAIEN